MSPIKIVREDGKSLRSGFAGEVGSRAVLGFHKGDALKFISGETSELSDGSFPSLVGVLVVVDDGLNSRFEVVVTFN